MVYTALLADIVDSKKLSKQERESAQLFIKACLEMLNGIFKPSLEFEVMFSGGDEVQGLFKSPVSAFCYFRLLRMLMAPLQIRCGIGIGDWDVKIPDGISSEQDGSAFHNARAAISAAHGKNYGVLINSGHANDAFINTLANTSLLFSKRQSRSQSRVALLVELMFPLFDHESMEIRSFRLIGTLIQKKTEFEIKPDDIEPVDLLSPLYLERGLTFVSTLKKGLSTKISALTGTSRQNIDKTIKTGNITEIRNIDTAAILLIYKTFGR